MYEVPPSEAGRRLDQFLVQSSGLSRSAVQRLMDQEQVRIGTRRRNVHGLDVVSTLMKPSDHA